MTRTTTANSSVIERFSGTTSTTTSTNNVLTAPKSSNGNKRPAIIIYPTVTPESIVVPIVSCIFGFPLLALTVICCLRRRAKLARERARRRNCELDRGELSVVRLSPVKNRPRAVSLVRSPRPPPALELDTVLEERSDPEQTTLSQVDITPDREVGTILFSAIGAVGSAAVSAAACARDS
ncbi:uncharacterized protein LOC116768977 [Danaus plexippus]|uniref:Uncharacterized protein n=1 Tax=Danaus plexippus plexippus TaxID=278856 RepID=A0A212FH97_DANPL|nr:uncharacterized protein LOC116768977 [Danaus plexippus]OWR53112.1 hypothetical protein KGM_204387 [Danaus plexippus plexippus]